MLSQLSTAPPPSEWLTVSVDWVQGTVVLCGELDRESAHHLADALWALSTTPHACWVVDTAGVTWCDVSGLRALAAACTLAAATGRELRLVRTSRCVDRLVRLSGLDRLIADTAAPLRALSGVAPTA